MAVTTPTHAAPAQRLVFWGVVIALGVGIAAFIATATPSDPDLGPIVSPVTQPPDSDGLDDVPTDVQAAIEADAAAGITTLGDSDGNPIGYIRDSDYVDQSISNVGRDVPFTVYGLETDKHIGYWYSGVGYVSIAQHDAPGFDFDQFAVNQLGAEDADRVLDLYRASDLRFRDGTLSPAEEAELDALVTKLGLEKFAADS